MLRAAERTNALQRAFNAREGIRRKDDYPWELVHPEAFEESSITRETYDKLLDEYYNLRGCDLKTGVPTKKRLEELGLEDVANDLSKRGMLSK